MNQFQLKFIDEAVDLLENLESAVLALESNTSDMSTIEEIFRVMHTFKGNSNMFGFEKIGEFTHHLENIYDNIRNGKQNVNKDILDITFASLDHIRRLLEDIDLSNNSLKNTHQELLSKVILIANGNASDTDITSLSTASDANGLNVYSIKIDFIEDVFTDGTNPIFLIEELCELGKSIAIPDTSNIPLLDNLDPEKCFVSWHVLLQTDQDENAIEDVFIFAEDSCTLKVDIVANSNVFEQDGFIDEFKLFTQGKTDLENLKSKVELPKEKEKEDQVDTVDITQKSNKISSIRVSAEKVDDMMNLVSELITMQASLSLLAEGSTDSKLIEVAESIEKLSRQLRDNTFSISLVPLESSINRFRRLVRDLSSELDKDIDFITEGTDTELDKNIIESLADPLLHIIRNSLDHGVETKAERSKTGKPAKATIKLKAYYTGANVAIEISDDGKGINKERVLSKAKEKGLISENALLSDKEVCELIFHPGFSTAEKVTSVSGRGVGMDVVMQTVKDLRGEIDVESHEGKGSTFTIKLPLSLSIIDGLLISIHNTKYVIPLGSIDRCELIPKSYFSEKLNNIIVLEGEQVPYINLKEEFEDNSDISELSQMVIVKFDDRLVGLLIDEIIGEIQAVLKPLGHLYKDQENVSGATILGDGSVALVIDTNQLIKSREEQKVNAA